MLPGKIRGAELTQAVPNPFDPARAEFVREALAGAAKQVARTGPGAEERDVIPPEVLDFRWNEAGLPGPLLHAFPEPVEEPVAVEGVAQHVGVKAFVEELAVLAGGPQKQPHLG